MNRKSDFKSICLRDLFAHPMASYKQLFGHLAAFSAYMIFGFNIVLTKDLTNAQLFTPISLFTLRALGAGLLFWTMSCFQPREHVASRDLVQIFFASLLGYFGTQMTFLVGIRYATPFDCSIVSTLSPIFTMLVAAVVLHEPLSRRKVGGVLISLIGILVLIFSSYSSLVDNTRTTTPTGIILLVLNSLCFAAYLGIFRPVIQRYSVVTFMKWIFLFSFLMAFPFSVSDLLQVSFETVPAKCLMELAYLIVCATFLAYFLIPFGQKQLRPTLVSLYSYVQPIIASCLGIYLGMDRLSVVKVVAVLLVVAGVVLVNQSRGRSLK